MASSVRERGEVKRATQAFRDLVVLLFLLLLALSIRFNDGGEQPTVDPLPGGVQAAGHEQAAPVAAEQAAMPALAAPEPEGQVQPETQVLDVSRDVETESRVLVYVDGEVHAFRLPARLSVTAPRTRSSEPPTDVLARS